MPSFKAVYIILAASNTNAVHTNWMIVNQLLHLLVSHSWVKNFMKSLSELHNFFVRKTWRGSLWSLQIVNFPIAKSLIRKNSWMFSFKFIDCSCCDHVELIHVYHRPFLTWTTVPNYWVSFLKSTSCATTHHKHLKQAKDFHFGNCGFDERVDLLWQFENISV